MVTLVSNDHSISEEVLLSDNLNYGQRERLHTAGDLLIRIPQQVYHLEELLNLLSLTAVGALNVSSSLIDGLNAFFLLAGLDFNCGSLICEERILEHRTKFIRVLLQRVEAHVIINVQFRLQLYAFALEELN